MDDGRRIMEGSPRAVEACSPTEVSPGLRGRADPDRRIGALVVRGPRATMHPARLHRRCHQQADASAVCREREHLRLFCSDTGLSGAPWQAGGVLLRQARGVPGQQEGCGRRRWHDPVRPGSACAEHRHHLRQLLAGQGPCGARQRNPAGSAGEGDAAMRHRQHRGWQLPAFMEQYNARFAKAPFDQRDVHRPLAGHDDLDDALAWKEERSVSMNLTLQYDQVLFILEPTGIARSLARKRVTVIDYPDGRLAIRHNGVDLPYRTFDKRPQVNQAAIVENKRLGPILAYIAEKQKELDMSRSAKAPRRRGQTNHMFKVE